MQQFESFAQMQRDAAMRVMEMQRRAQAAMKDPVPVDGLPAVTDLTDGSPLCEPETEIYEAADEEQDKKKPEITQEETEKALITAILLLLMRENADERLLFALMYILM
jgi:hypothetical protein